MPPPHSPNPEFQSPSRGIGQYQWSLIQSPARGLTLRFFACRWLLVRRVSKTTRPMGKAYKSALLVIIDRTILLTVIEKVTSRKAEMIASCIIERLRPIPSTFLKTMTFDNDKAFAYYQSIAEALNVNTYFTRPYISQDKGSVENRIGVIRRFFPKGTALRKVSEEKIKKVQQYLNFRPIRKFNYLSPIQQTLKHRRVALMC